MGLRQTDARQRVSVDQCANTPRVTARERGAGGTAHGLANERNPLEFQIIQEPQQVIQIAGLAESLNISRIAEGPMVNRDCSVVLRKAWHLVKPAGMVAADSVG